MDERIESFLRDVLALEGINADEVREGVRVHLAEFERFFRDAESDAGKKDAAERFRKRCRDRVIEEIQQRTTISTIGHFQIVLSVMDNAARSPLNDG